MKKIFYAVMVSALLFSVSCVPTTTNNNNKPNNKVTDNTTDNNVINNNDDNTPTPIDNDKKDDVKPNDDNDKNSFKSQDGRFSIDFPTPPTGPTKTTYSTLAGTIENFQYVCTKGDNGSYFVSYSDYPAGAITDANVESSLKKEAEAFMKKLGSKIDKSSSERLDGNKGLSFSGKRDNLVINMRSYFVGKRYFVIGTIAEETVISTKESNRFINSFKIK